jgi:C-terminal processing protease CtpA/Prc
MVIGNEVFKNYSIIFDWNLQKMYFKKNANLSSKKTSEFISFGFGFIKNGDKIEVVKLIKNSEAEKKGLLIGDEVLTINDVIFKNIKDNQFCDFFYFGLKEFKLGDIINVKVLRNNEELKFTLTKENYFN